jgi:hypothetical protein
MAAKAVRAPNDALGRLIVAIRAPAQPGCGTHTISAIAAFADDGRLVNAEIHEDEPAGTACLIHASRIVAALLDSAMMPLDGENGGRR